MLNVELNISRITADLNALSDDLKDKAVKAGIAKVTKAGLEFLKGEAPEATGGLRKSLNRKNLTLAQKRRMGIPFNSFVVMVGPNRRVEGRFKSRIGNILEGGAAAHIIKPGKSSLRIDLLEAQGMHKKASVLYNAKTGKFFGKLVNHPGISARLWMYNSDSRLASQAQGLFYQGIQDYLNRRQA